MYIETSLYWNAEEAADLFYNADSSFKQVMTSKS